jgi:glycosyltransferase involved in cell wall biosynthesis
MSANSKIKIVIATRNRKDDLGKTLLSVTKAAGVFREILIVDSSEDPELNCQTINSFVEKNFRIRHIRSNSGLPLQRLNGYLLSAGAEIIHFLDDDVDLCESYFDGIESLFSSDPDLVGVGGNQVNLTSQDIKLSFEAKMGKVQKNGTASGLYNLKGDSKVEWLPGCAMSYRYQAMSIDDFPINFGGYALFEDLYLSIRIGSRGKLAISFLAQVNHRVSAINRQESFQLSYYDVVNRYFLVRDNPSNFSLMSFRFYVLKRILRKFVGSFFSADSRKHLQSILKGLRAILS